MFLSGEATKNASRSLAFRQLFLENGNPLLDSL